SRSSEINPHIGETAADKILRRFCEARLLDIILDFHGARDNDTFEVAIGTGGVPRSPAQRRVMEVIVSSLCDVGLSIAINPPMYSGHSPHSIVARHRRVRQVGVLQIEIVRQLRNPLNPRAMLLLNGLVAAIKRLRRAT